jgi:hypothetical protein
VVSKEMFLVTIASEVAVASRRMSLSNLAFRQSRRHKRSSACRIAGAIQKSIGDRCVGMV